MRIAPDLNLGTAALRGSAIEEVAPSSGRLGHCRQLLPRDARKEGHSVALVKSAASGFDELERQYQEVYAEQLPGVPYYDDCHHLLLTLDGPREVLAGGATVRLLLLTVASRLADERILLVDVLGLCTSPDEQGRGVGSKLVAACKSLARREAAARGARPVLVTQADNACLSFWEKNAFAQAVDACALVLRCREWSEDDCVVFNGATPMALALRRPLTERAGASAAGGTQRALSAGSRAGL